METILRYEYLWKKVRVLGGAYGAFTQFLRMVRPFSAHTVTQI